MVAIAEITPTARINVIDLLERAGLDVSDWGGATNRSKSSEWTFGEANDAKVLTIWTSELQEIDGAIIRQIEPKRYLSESTPRQVRRAQRFIDAVRIAFNQQLPVQVILCVLNPQRTGAQFRDLDPEIWCVTTHDEVRDVYTLVRGALPVAGEIDFEVQGFREGPRRQLFVIHRRREAEARWLKLEQHRRNNNGRLRLRGSQLRVRLRVSLWRNRRGICASPSLQAAQSSTCGRMDHRIERPSRDMRQLPRNGSSGWRM